MANKKCEVFISFKCTKLDGSCEKTRDYELALDLFNRLRKENIEVFFSEKDIHSANFNAAIDKALDEARVLVAVGTCLEHLNSGRVLYEWDSFADDITDGIKPNGELFNYIDGISARELPRKLRRNQAYSPDNVESLISDIKRCLNNNGRESVNSTLSAAELNDKGEDYYYGRNGVKQDYSEAVKYFMFAAEHGHARAQNNLGCCYHNGEGVKKDYSKAVRYYRLAAEQGNASAQNNLGYCYYHGEGVKQDYSEAVRYYRLAAEQGNAKAKNHLIQLGEL